MSLTFVDERDTKELTKNHIPLKSTETRFSRVLLKIFVALVPLLFSFAAVAQIPNYSFIGQTVNKRSAATGEILSSGHLLEDSLIGQDEVIKVTMRYASDAVAYTRQGVLHSVERLMDFYYPSPDIILEYGGGLEITDLPLMVVLHAGQGTKDKAEDYARYWASMGFTVIAPTVRSDRLGINYCAAYPKTIYLSVQDIRGAIRMYSKLYDYSKMKLCDLRQLVSTHQQRVLLNHFRKSRSDGMSIFMVGKSYGGSMAFHTATRVLQESYEEYIWSDTPYIVQGIDGPVDLGNSGLLDDVGLSFAKNYPFPIDRLKGIVCRTAGVFYDIATIDYTNGANPVPGSFIHNTCDALVPYTSRTFIHNEGLCDADITRPDGSVDTSLTLFGSSPITENMAAAGVYSELITFCGGGHDSNKCNHDIIEGHASLFVRRILSHDYVPGDRVEQVYRYDFQNYSNQCCEIGDEYEFMLKCSCDETNPYNVIDLPYLSPDKCSLSTSCDLISLCDLEPIGLMGNHNGLLKTEDVFTMELINIADESFFKVMSPHKTLNELLIVDTTGRVLHKTSVDLEYGINIFPVPAELPTGQILIARLGSVKTVKFLLAP